MAVTTLQWITNRARQIRRSRPSMKWLTAVREASAEYNIKAPRASPKKKKKKRAAPAKRKKISGTRPKKSTRKAMPKRKISGAKVAAAPRRKKRSGMSGVRVKAREQKAVIKEALGDAMVDQYSARTKTEKRKIGKRVAMLKKQLTTVGKLI